MVVVVVVVVLVLVLFLVLVLVLVIVVGVGVGAAIGSFSLFGAISLVVLLLPVFLPSLQRG